MKTINHPHYLALIAILVIPLSGLAVDIYAPSLPAVSQHFQATKSLTQLTITAYMVGVGCMQLFAGVLSDTFGRRMPFLIGTFVFIIATLTIPISQNIYQLIALRFIQGIMLAATIVPMRSVIPDLFQGKALYQWMNYMTMAWSIGPIVAPALGGYLQHYLGWKSNFYFLAAYATLTGILVYYCLPETSQYRHRFHIGEIIGRYRLILSNKEYLFSLGTNALLYSMLILFTVVGPFLVQSVMHYSPIIFGYVALLIGLMWFLGTLTNRLLVNVNLKKKAKVCLWGMLVIAMMNFILSWYVPLNLYALVFPIVFMTWLGGIVFPNNFAYAVSLFPTMTGSANALFGGFIYIITGMSSGLATSLKSTHSTPLAMSYVGIIGLCLVIAYFRQWDVKIGS